MLSKRDSLYIKDTNVLKVKEWKKYSMQRVTKNSRGDIRKIDSKFKKFTRDKGQYILVKGSKHSEYQIHEAIHGQREK